MHEDINFTEKVHDPKHGSESGLCPMTQILGDYQHWLSIDGSKFVPVSVASVASTSSQRYQQKFYLETRTQGEGTGVVSSFRTHGLQGEASRFLYFLWQRVLVLVR